MRFLFIRVLDGKWLKFNLFYPFFMKKLLLDLFKKCYFDFIYMKRKSQMMTKCTAALLFIFLSSTLLYAGFYPSFKPIVGRTVQERELNAHSQCTTICASRKGWNGKYSCSEKAFVDAYHIMRYQVFGCQCECLD